MITEEICAVSKLEAGHTLTQTEVDFLQVVIKNAQRYMFLRDKEAFGGEDEPGLVTWDELTDADLGEFDEAVDARMAHYGAGNFSPEYLRQGEKAYEHAKCTRYAIKAEGMSEVLKDVEGYANLTHKEVVTLLKNWLITFQGLSEGVKV